jgi:hypothetical protein
VPLNGVPGRGKRTFDRRTVLRSISLNTMLVNGDAPQSIALVSPTTAAMDLAEQRLFSVMLPDNFSHTHFSGLAAPSVSEIGKLEDDPLSSSRASATRLYHHHALDSITTTSGRVLIWDHDAGFENRFPAGFALQTSNKGHQIPYRPPQIRPPSPNHTGPLPSQKHAYDSLQHSEKENTRQTRQRLCRGSCRTGKLVLHVNSLPTVAMTLKR